MSVCATRERVRSTAQSRSPAENAGSHNSSPAMISP